VGSFYAFTIFIGIGVLALYEMLKDKFDQKWVAISVSGVCLLAVPVLMAAQNWDDHDRSGRHTAHDFAYNYLIGLDKNALIFTNGDNDTFPLWYIQEVEGVRTDVRVCCMPFLPQDWYIDQLKRTYYGSKALPISMNLEQYRQGKRGMIPIQNTIKTPTDLKKLIDFATSDDPRALIESSTGRKFNYIPSSTFLLAVDKNKVVTNGTVATNRAAQVDSAIVWSMGQDQIYKDELVMLDILAHNDWDRPIYYTTPRQTGSVKLDNYLELQGLSYRLIPIKGELQTGMSGMVNTDIMFDNVVNKFKYTNLNNPKVYQDENCRRMMQNMRSNFNRLATVLIEEGKTDKALQVLNKLESIMPMKVVGFTASDIDNGSLWIRAGNKAKGVEVARYAFNELKSDLDYYLSLPANYFPSVDYDAQYALYQMKNMVESLSTAKEEELVKEFEPKLGELYTRYLSKSNRR